MTTLSKVEQSLSAVVAAKAALQEARRARDDNKARADYHLDQASLYESQIPALKDALETAVVQFKEDVDGLGDA